jgi:hypothetical protein
MPFHHVDLLTGIKAGMGGLDFLSPNICQIRKYPVSGSEFNDMFLPPSKFMSILTWPSTNLKACDPNSIQLKNKNSQKIEENIFKGKFEKICTNYTRCLL